MGAPVCSIIPPDRPGEPTGRTVPTIPVASDMASLIAAVNAIRAWINAQQNPQRQREDDGSGRGGIIPPKPQPKQPQPKIGRWNEISRSTKKVRIENPDDPSQFVEIEQITNLVMQDSVTKETWTWSQ